jgi:putative ABC transport system permease protein
MNTLLQDLRYALRTLRKAPGFSAVAVLTLALGIGASTTIFSVVNGVLLRPLPFAEPERLFAVISHAVGDAIGAASPADFVDWRAEARTAELAAYNTTTFSLRGAEAAERIPGARVSAELFRVLRASPALGRTFLPEDEMAGQGQRVVLGYDLWQREFNGAPEIVGQTIRLEAVPYTVVGIMPRGFEFPIEATRAQLWVPLTLAGDASFQNSRGGHSLTVIGRLAPGATEAQLQGELRGIAARLAEQYPATNAEWTVSVRALADELVGGARQALLVLAGAVCFLLLIACANVANLMLARATARARDIAVRFALGASRGAVIRQLVTEGLVLALIGGVVGVVLAAWGVGLILAHAPVALPRLGSISLDGRVLAFTLIVSVASGLLFAIVPAWQAAAVGLHSVLKESGRGVAGGRTTHHLRGGLVVSEIALSLMLLAGAGLLATSFTRLQRLNPGFEPRGHLTTSITLSRTSYPSEDQRRTLFDRILEETRAIPGVDGAGLVTALPLSGRQSVVGMNLEGEAAPASGGFSHAVDFDIVSSDYFRVQGIPLRAGRPFEARDDGAAPLVVIVSQAFANRYWPGQDPIGKRLQLALPRGDSREVVGVVGDIHSKALDKPVAPALYIPLGQMAQGSMALVVQTRGQTGNVPQALREVVARLDPDLALATVRPMEEVLATSLARQQFSALLLGIFAVAALALSAIGIYGVMASLVVQRTREVAIRMALGAQPRDVLGLVVRHSAALTGAGMALGLGGALALSRLLANLLYEVRPGDPLTLAAVSALLGGVALLASYLPARRATRVDPMVVLRSE